MRWPVVIARSVKRVKRLRSKRLTKLPLVGPCVTSRVTKRLSWYVEKLNIVNAELFHKTTEERLEICEGARVWDWPEAASVGFQLFLWVLPSQPSYNWATEQVCWLLSGEAVVAVGYRDAWISSSGRCSVLLCGTVRVTSLLCFWQTWLVL